VRHYAIIGQTLGHSWSQRWWTDFFATHHIHADYVPYEIDDIASWYRLIGATNQLQGYSVTIPYKQQIIPYLSDLDPIAREIGAVNVVRDHTGYNTDWIGFRDSIAPYILTRTRALVLGTGGVARAVRYALQTMNIDVTMVSRHHGLTYDQLTTDILHDHPILVNCTPLGMWPEVNACPDIPYHAITSAHLLFDCIYNPEQTLFLQRGAQQGATTINGKQMLINQALAAWQIWKQ